MIDQKTLKELLEYNPESGVFTYVHRDRKWFSSEAIFKSWNKRRAGTKAGSEDKSNGSNYLKYIRIKLLNKSYRAHRLAFIYMTGCDPKKEVDHVNGNGLDNKWSNLRHVSKNENSKNRSKHKNNTSGKTGVYWYKSYQKWSASIRVDGVLKHIGYFDNYETACKKRKQAEKEFGFHKNHGREKGA